MSYLGKNGKRAVITKFPYVCSHCRHLGHASPRTRNANSTSPKLAHNPAYQYRHVKFFSTTSPSASLDTVTAGFPPPPPPWPLPNPNRQPSIRDQLRTWSVQNEHRKAAEIKDGITPSRSRNVRIPQSQWLDETVDDIDYQDLALDEHYDRHLEDGELASIETLISPGDIIYLSQSKNSAALVLVLAKIGASGFWLHVNGQVSTSRWRFAYAINTLKTTIQNFATPAEIDHVLEFLPQKSLYKEDDSVRGNVATHAAYLPKRATQLLTTRMRDLIDRMKAFRRTHLHSHDKLYEQLALDQDYDFVRFDHLVQSRFGLKFDSLDDAGRMSVFYLIHKEPDRMHLIQQSHNSALGVVIVPKSITRTNAEVAQWSRQYQQAAADAAKGLDVKAALAANPLTSFINKSRRIILQSRRIRSPTTLGILGPSKQANQHDDPGAKQSSGEEFSDSDKKILDLIWDVCIRAPQPPHRRESRSVVSLILRAVGAYPKLSLDLSISRLFMQELGIKTPWAEKSEDDVTLPLSGIRSALSRKFDRINAQLDDMAKDWPKSRDQGPSPAIDTMSHLRKDFGDLPVLCIDPHTTFVVDDGISFEPSQTHHGAGWIHVHIAHPSAFFDRDSLVVQAGKIKGSSVYNAGKLEFMISERIAHYLGLAPGAEALTVSTLLSEAGEVLDIKITPTLLKNVVRLDKISVNRLLGHKEVQMASMVIGPDTSRTTPVKSEHFEIAASQREAQALEFLPLLRRMRTLLLARFHQRRKEVSIPADYYVNHDTKHASVNLQAKGGGDRLGRSIHYLSDPTIALYAKIDRKPKRVITRDRESDITTHAMWLCAESAGKWLKDRRIPAVFSGTQVALGWPLERLNAASPGARLVPPSQNIQVDPTPHIALNMHQYCQTTSPLRRCPDLIAQLNIDAYLRGEAEGLVEPGASAPAEFVFPMSRGDIIEYVKDNFWSLGATRHTMKHTFIHFSSQALFRAFHFKEAILPDVWDVEINVTIIPEYLRGLRADLTGQIGSLLPFGSRCYLLRSEEGFEQEATPRQYLPCKIEVVDSVKHCVFVRPVGKASDTPTTEWKDIYSPSENGIDQSPENRR